MNNNWIKLFSKLLDWEWYKNQNTKDLFIHCLLKANWKDGYFQGAIVPRGSFVTSLEKLSEELSMSVQSIRTALKHLISTGELTSTNMSKYRLVSIKNYELYQPTNKKINKQLTTIEEYKTINNITNINNIANLLSKKFDLEIGNEDIELIDKWLSNFSEEVIIYAIKLALLARRKNILYVNGILKQWKQQNLNDLEEIKKINELSETQKKEKVELFDYDWLNEGDEY